MNIHSHDQDLLLLAHGELTSWRKMTTQAHVTFCKRCQARVGKWEQTSAQIAEAVRGGDLPRWPRPVPQGALTAARWATAWLLAVCLLALLTLGVLFHTAAVGHRPALPAAALHSKTDRAPDGGCRPDLPNDQCR